MNFNLLISYLLSIYFWSFILFICSAFILMPKLVFHKVMVLPVALAVVCFVMSEILPEYRGLLYLTYKNFLLITILVFMLANLKYKWLAFGLFAILVAGLMNMLVIIANDFRIPVAIEAVNSYYDYVLISESTKFPWLADWIRMPAGFASPGDLVGFAGLVIIFIYALIDLINNRIKERK